MAYIPTIHTFEDDLKENQPLGQAPNTPNPYLSNSKSGGDILVPDKKSSSLTKKILLTIAIIFILASLSILGYYFYNKYTQNKNLNNLNADALARQRAEEAEANKNTLNDLSEIFPKLAPGISPYVKSASKKDGVVTLTLKTDVNNSNYSSFYAYLLAHTRDLNSDLFYAFHLADLMNSLEEQHADTSSSSTDMTIETSSSSLIINPTLISSENINWENKTLNNRDFKVASAGVLTLVYGYDGYQYAIFTTSLKKYFDTVDDLK